MLRVQLPDDTVVEVPPNATARSVAANIGEGLARAAIGARIGGELTDADRPLLGAAATGASEPLLLSIVTVPRVDKAGRSKFRDPQHERDALLLLRHSAAHVMAEAILRIHPSALLAYGPALESGFYYDLALETPISSDGFAAIEAEMASIVEEDRPFTRRDVPFEEGLAILRAENNKYKTDNAERARERGAKTLSWYVTGDPASGCFEDLCQGPHVDRSSRIGAFKLTAVAQSHWRGDVSSDRFQRVYGTAFFTPADLAAHLEQLEQARKRDHRVIGRRLNLFTIDEAVGGGLVLWKPDGAVIRQELQTFIGEHLTRQGYSQVFTPHIGKLGLYRTSGHFPYYADSQFPPLIDRETIGRLADEGCSCAELSARLAAGDVDGYMLKPMNCPHHIRIYADGKYSHRDLPIRLAEFGTVYRWEQSGELGGMTRVRGFTQDDAHLFVTPAQLEDEVRGCIDLVKAVFATLGMNQYRVRVGLRDPDSSKFVGDPADWDLAETACRAAAESLGVPFTEEPGEAAFYGPKIDFVVRDVIGREWQLGTVQVDYQLPQRFGLSYTGADNAEHTPVMIHRAPFGSMERFVGCLIEHFGGRFPLWLAPHQVRVLPVSDRFDGYAHEVARELKHAGLRVGVDTRSGRVGAKIAAAQAQEVPYMLVVGGQDQNAGTVSVRTLTADLGAMPRTSFLAKAIAERDSRALTGQD